MKTSNSTKSSYSAFTDVDELVAKPVLGSDGAASWQEWKKESSSKSSSSSFNKHSSSAPGLPMKRADKIGTGLKSLQEERLHEDHIRKEAGEAAVGEGYTVFKRKRDDDDNDGKKQNAPRVRPDDVPYFIPSKTFTGYKQDYVFSTKNRGTGYYWDSVGTTSSSSNCAAAEDDGGNPNPVNTNTTKRKEHKKKQKKKKKKHQDEATPVTESNNPFEQVEAALARRNIATTGPISNNNDADSASLTAAGWAMATDPSTNRRYYFHAMTKETKWENPLTGTAATVTKGGTHNNGDVLPKGWSTARDANNKEYFYHTNGKTCWDRPWV